MTTAFLVIFTRKKNFLQGLIGSLAKCNSSWDGEYIKRPRHTYLPLLRFEVRWSLEYSAWRRSCEFIIIFHCSWSYLKNDVQTFVYIFFHQLPPTSKLQIVSWLYALPKSVLLYLNRVDFWGQNLVGKRNLKIRSPINQKGIKKKKKLQEWSN